MTHLIVVIASCVLLASCGASNDGFAESLTDQRWFRDNNLSSEVGRRSRTFQLALEGLGTIREEDSGLPDQAQRRIYVVEDGKMVRVFLRREKTKYMVVVEPASNTYNLLEWRKGYGD